MAERAGTIVVYVAGWRLMPYPAYNIQQYQMITPKM
jgi:hypothetical protein